MADMNDEILKQFAENLLRDFAEAVPKATGKTASSLELSIRKKGFDISISSYIDALINGRKPTSSGAKRSTPTLQQSILEWIKAKGIQPRESTMSQESLSWAISKYIHKNGFNGKGNFFDGILTENRINSLTDTILDRNSPVIESNILKQFDFR